MAKRQPNKHSGYITSGHQPRSPGDNVVGKVDHKNGHTLVSMMRMAAGLGIPGLACGRVNRSELPLVSSSILVTSFTSKPFDENIVVFFVCWVGQGCPLV
jgi:hypothetical protein